MVYYGVALLAFFGALIASTDIGGGEHNYLIAVLCAICGSMALLAKKYGLGIQIRAVRVRPRGITLAPGEIAEFELPYELSQKLGALAEQGASISITQGDVMQTGNTFSSNIIVLVDGKEFARCVLSWEVSGE